MLVLSDIKLQFLNKQFMLKRVAFLMTYNAMNVYLSFGDIGKLEIDTIRVFSEFSHFLRNNRLLDITRVLKIRCRHPPSKKARDCILFIF